MDLCPGFEANVGQWPDGVRFLPLGTKPGARLAGRKRMLARANYFIGDDPVCWRTGVPSFASVAYESLYPEVTLIFRRSGGGFEYDVVLEPHVDPQDIRFRFDGASGTRIDTDGSLVVTIPGGELRQPRPFAYQRTRGRAH